MSSKSNSSQDGPLQTVSRTASTEPQIRYISRPVRAAQAPDPLGDFLRLGGLIGSILVIVLLVVSVIGLIGIRLGFEPSFGLPNRSLGWSDFLVFGFEMVRTLPDIITRVGNQTDPSSSAGFHVDRNTCGIARDRSAACARRAGTAPAGPGAGSCRFALFVPVLHWCRDLAGRTLESRCAAGCVRRFSMAISRGSTPSSSSAVSTRF